VLAILSSVCGNITENPDLPNKLLMSDEAHFHLHGTDNKGLFEK
jgi:hypothetical protein